MTAGCRRPSGWSRRPPGSRDVVPVHPVDGPAESLELARVGRDVMTVHGRLGLAQPVDVHDRH